MPFRAVLFDFGGTLDANGIPWKDNFLPIYRKHGITAPQEKFDRAFYDADDNFHLNHAVAGMSFEDTVHLQVRDTFENLGADLRPAQAVAGEFLANAREFFRRNTPVLEELSRRYKLGVVSNFYGNMDSVLKSEGLARFFGAVADSRAVGAEKPDAAIFNHALKLLGAKPGEAVMVGDSVKRDMAGAKNLGMATVLLWGGRAQPAPAEFNPITRLSQLPQAIRELEAATV
ncbi:MAG: HAD family hydrolase [Elusimicrobiales bacterium]